MIATFSELQNFSQLIQESPWVAVDTEADSLHSYPEKICLVQVSLPGHDMLIDPLAGLDLKPFFAALQDKELIMHGSDYDLRLMHKYQQFIPSRIFDTMLAARFLGIQKFGLGDLVSQFLGVTLKKDHQKANWAKRPLLPKMIEYAMNDTRYLQPLAAKMKEQMEQLGRVEWHRQSCQRMIQDCTRFDASQNDDNWRVGGCESYSRKELAILRALWQWRENLALINKRPPFFVISHKILLDMAKVADNPEAVQQLIPRHFSPNRRATLLEALEKGLATPLADQPHPIRNHRRRLSKTEVHRYQLLQTKRDIQAAKLGMDASFIASRGLLVAVACKDRQAVLMPWQEELLSLEPAAAVVTR